MGKPVHIVSGRNYLPSLSQWLSIDPMARERYWLSSYNYSQNSSFMRVDPSGRLDKAAGALKDVIVILAPNAAGGAGHLGLLVGNDTDGWRYISKEGTSERKGLYGKSDKSTSSELGGKIYKDVNDWAKEHNIPDENGIKRYTEGYLIRQDKDEDKKVLVESLKYAKDIYSVLGNNCADCVRMGLEKAGYEKPFNEKETKYVGKENIPMKTSTLPLQPNNQYKALKKNISGQIMKL